MDKLSCISESCRAFRNTKDVGDVSLLALQFRFMELGIPVLVPLSDNERYDFLIELKDGFKKVQAKTGRSNGEIIKFAARSTNSTRQEATRVKDYRDDCDFFGVYCHDNHKCYLLAVDDVPNGEVTLRLIPPKNKIKKGIRWAVNFEL